jgi:DNA polymerase III epsilon subunit-like protein
MSRSKRSTGETRRDMEMAFVFDTETTGLPPFIEYKGRQMRAKFIKGKNIEGWPFIIQLSGILYNMRTHEYSFYNKYIDTERIPEDVLEECSQVPIIKAALTEYEKAKPMQIVSPEQAMDDFMEMISSCDVVVGHNVNFDKYLILAELKRLEDKHESDGVLKKKYETWYKHFDQFNNTVSVPKILYCTQCASSMILNIKTQVTPNKTRRKRINYTKPPALWEAYDRMFGHPPLKKYLHNALVDIIVTLRVFYRLWMTGNRHPGPSSAADVPNFAICGLGEPDIYGKGRGKKGKRDLITKYIDKITPQRSPLSSPSSPPMLGLHDCFRGDSPYRTLEDGTKANIAGGRRSCKKKSYKLV